MTQSDRFAARFAVLAQKKEGAFVPFVNLCDPTPEISSQILEALAAGGADALELGIPFPTPAQTVQSLKLQLNAHSQRVQRPPNVWELSKRSAQNTRIFQ